MGVKVKYSKKEGLYTTNHLSVLELQKAMKNNEFTLHYQPQIISKTGKIGGFEVLIRWNHPSYGLLYPNAFIEMAESSGYIVDLGKWILKTACYQVKKWREMYQKPFYLSVNIAIKQLLDYRFVPFIKGLLDEMKLEAKYLILEITERITDDIKRVVNPLERLRKLGVQISLDDFGKGYNSLYYLKELPVDQIKIDRSFINDVSNKRNRVIVKSMIDTAKLLGLEIVAEGIETKKEKELFSSYCDYLQGFYFAKPMPIQDVEQSLIHAV